MKKKHIPSRFAKANTALVFLIENATPDDRFGIEFAPYDETLQCIDGQKFYKVVENGKPVEFDNSNVPFTFIAPVCANYRIVNLGFDDTKACVSLIGTYEVQPYVKRSNSER